MVQGQLNTKCAALVDPAFNLDISPVGMGDVPADGKAQPAAPASRERALSTRQNRLDDSQDVAVSLFVGNV